MFAGNDLPGVMLAGGVRRLIALYGIAPGTRAVVATTSDRGLEAARALEAGVVVAAVADLREGRPRSRRPHASTCRARPCRGAQARARRRPGSDSTAATSGASNATCWSCRAAWRRPPRSSRRPADAPPTTPRAGTSPWPSCPTACTPRARSPARRARRREPSGAHAGAQAAHALGLADATAAAARRRRPSAAPRRPCPGRGRRRAREVLRLPVRGRHGQGHPPERRRGLRLDRALQALHDGDDGPLPGTHVPAARRAADGPGDRPGPGAGRHHHGAPAVVGGPPRRAGRPPVRARQALGHPSPPPRARRARHVGGRLAARLRLRRSAGRGAGRPRERGAHRRLDAGQAHRPRPRGGRVPRSPLPQPLREPRARAASATAC